MEYTSSVSIEVNQKNGETVYSNFSAEVNGKEYSKNEKEKNEYEEEIFKLLDELYEEMEAIHNKWKRRRLF